MACGCSKEDRGVTPVRASCSWVVEGLACQCGPAQIRDGATWEDAGTHSLSPPEVPRRSSALDPGYSTRQAAEHHDVPRMA